MSKFLLTKEHKTKENQILLEIEINNPKKLNVLNKEIVFHLNQTLKTWEKRDDLKLIFMHSSGEKAFCAGGDVVEVVQSLEELKTKGKDISPVVKSFFKLEYETDLRMSEFQKPIVLWGSGIVMGGGLGLFMASSHPIVTETSMLSMPEISIGFFPDVGASYFLNQMPFPFNLWLPLTAYRLNAKEALFLSLSRFSFSSDKKKELFSFLKEVSFSSNEEFSNKLKELEDKALFLLEQKNGLQDHETEIKKALKDRDLKGFYEFMKKSEDKDKTWSFCKKNVLKASPTSMAIIFEQLKRAKTMSLKECFQMEETLAYNLCCKGDFLEGVRALLIDKTGDPKWQPSSVTDIKKEDINFYFQK